MLAGLLRCVNSLMPNERRTDAKGPPTPLALEGLFARVDPQVLDQTRAPTKAFPTLFALIGLHSGVHSLVSNEM